MITLIYLGKTIACSMLLYGYYFFALRNSRYHQQNRVYLLSIPLVSILLPLIKISFAGPAAGDPANMINSIAVFGSWEEEFVVHAGVLQSSFLISVQNIYFIIYVIIAVLVISPFFRSWLHIRALKRNAESEEHNGITVFRIKDQRSPFSFFNAIFWSENTPLDSEASQTIFHHEYYHIKQKHGVDLIYMAIIQSLFWINPFNYFIRKELASIHEFMADRYAIAQSDKYTYAELLVLTAIENKNLLTHQFFNNQIKRRISMITKNKLNRMHQISRLALLPFVLFVFSVFCLRLKAQNVDVKAPDTLSAAALKNIDGSDVKSISVNDNNVRFVMKNNQEFIATRKSLNEVMRVLQDEEDKQPTTGQKTEKTFLKPEIEASYPGGVSAWTRYLSTHVKYPVEALKKSIEGTVTLQFIVGIDGSVEDVTVLSGPTEGGLREHAVEVLRNSGKWMPAVENGKPVRAYKKMPITFRLN